MAVLILGPGIGANPAIFSVLNAVLIRSLPFRNPGRPDVGPALELALIALSVSEGTAFAAESRPRADEARRIGFGVACRCGIQIFHTLSVIRSESANTGLRLHGSTRSQLDQNVNRSEPCITRAPRADVICPNRALT